MSSPVLTAAPLTAEAFSSYGEVLEARGASVLINDGRCRRYTDLAGVDIQDGRAGVSLFSAATRAWPVEVPLVERHPLGSQCFLPMSDGEWLVVVASDDGGIPVRFRAFLARGDQGANLARGIWHGVLCPLGPPGGQRLFGVVDRIGAGSNLEEYPLDRALTVIK